MATVKFGQGPDPDYDYRKDSIGAPTGGLITLLGGIFILCALSLLLFSHASSAPLLFLSLASNVVLVCVVAYLNSRLRHADSHAAPVSPPRSRRVPTGIGGMDRKETTCQH